MLDPGTVVERYEVVRPLGEGGMAKVWLVRHTTLNTLHALKVLQMTGPSLRLRFIEEGRAQSVLRHENIVRVSDVLEVEGLPALVLDYIDGPDLMHWIARELPDPARAEAVFRGILAGVQAAHAEGIVHRDLKPANVMMAKGPDGAWLPKVADFGLAKALTVEDSRGFATRQGHPMGTPRYMAPEQIRDASKADLRSDLFALGAILYELLAHEPAFDGVDVVEIFEAVGKGRRKPLPAHLPAHLVAVVDHCLQLDPVARPADVAAILRALDAGHPTHRSMASAAAVPVAMWLGAWAVVVGAGAIAAGGVLLLAFLGLRGGDPDEPCAVGSGALGVVRAPTVFSKRTGDTWLLREDLQVLAEPPAVGGAPEPVCTLVRGTRLALTEEPIVVGRERWIPVDAANLTLPVAGDPELGEDRGPCEGEPGAFVGYLRTRAGGILGGNTPREGGTFSVPAGREVFAFVASEDGQEPPVVCVLAEPTRFRVEGEPVKVAKEWWIPFVLPDPAAPPR
jgi:hypothetical protein